MTRRKLRKDKRGSGFDLIYIIIVLAFFACGIIITYAVFSSWDDLVQNNADIPTVAKTANTQIDGVFTGALSWGFILFMVLLAAGSIALAAMVRVHTVFIFLFLFVWLLSLVLAGMASNVFDEMASSTALSTAASQLSFISLAARSLPWFIGITGLLIMIVMYKTREGAEY